MARLSFFIDGFNFYHALNNVSLRRFKWINLRKLMERYLRKQDSLVDVFYFTAFSKWNPDKVKRHELFIKVQESFGVTPVYGEFRLVSRRCRNCLQEYDTYEEKETDVNIALKLFERAHLDTYDNAVILSADSDQIPTVRTMKRIFPGKKVGILIPPGGKALLLSQEADFHSKIGLKQLASARLPDSFTLADGTLIHCPKQWT